MLNSASLLKCANFKRTVTLASYILDLKWGYIGHWKVSHVQEPRLWELYLDWSVTLSEAQLCKSALAQWLTSQTKEKLVL